MTVAVITPRRSGTAGNALPCARCPSLLSLPASSPGCRTRPVGDDRTPACVDHDGVTVIDTLMTSDQYEPFAAEVEAIGLPVRRIVLTGSSVEQAGGTGRLKLAAVYGSRQASVHLDRPRTSRAGVPSTPPGPTCSTTS